MNEELKVIISAETKKLKDGVSQAKKEITGFSEETKKKVKEASEEFKKYGDAVQKGLKVAAGAIVAAGTALLALGASTAEYRNQQAQLVTAFEAAGSSAETAKSTYNDLYRVLGDTGQAQEAAAHLAKLTNNQKDLKEWTTICQGVYATFGDSLPIEGLTEAANETIKTGQVTGVLADALNWAGISEDEFNKKLEKCNTEAEREKLIRETLNGTYSDAAERYETNNQAILAQNEAQTKLNDAMARLGEVVAPINTMLTELAAEVLSTLAPYIEEFAANHLPAIKEALAGVAEKIGAVISWIVDNWVLVSTLASIILGIAAALSVVSTVMGVVNAVMAASPVTWVVLGIVAAIAALTAIITVCVQHWDAIKAAAATAIEGIKAAWGAVAEWFGGIVEGIRNAFAGIGEWLANLFVGAWNGIQKAWAGVKDWFAKIWEGIKSVYSTVATWFTTLFTNAWQGIQNAWNSVLNWFSNLWNGIKNVYNAVATWFSNIFKSAWNGIQSAWGSVKSWFSGIWDGIRGIFSAVGSWFSGIFTSAVNGIKNVFSGITGFFSGIWNSIKTIFSNVGTAIATGIKGAVSTAVNKVLSVACSIINGFIKAINFAIDIINAIPGVNIGRIQELSVPAMAKGGVVDSATLAMIGEQGKEAVVPLENNLGWLNKLADMLNERMGESDSGRKNIILQVDGKTFAQTSIDSINQLTRQTGSLGLALM